MTTEQQLRFHQALENFRASDYATAIQLWESLEEEGCSEPNLPLFLKAARTERSRVMAHVTAAGEALATPGLGAGEIVSSAQRVAHAREHLRAGRTGEALAALEEALQIDPDNEVVAVALARLQLFQGRLREAQALANRLVLAHPQGAQAHALSGHVLLEMDAIDRAQEAFDRALELSPGLPEALLGGARVDDARRRPAAAARKLGLVLSARPDDPIATGFLEDVSWQIRCNTRAIEECQAELSRNPEFADWHFKLGQLRAQNGDEDGALAAYTQALRINPVYERCRYERALLLHARGKRDEALADMRGSFEMVSGAIDAAGIMRAGELESAGDLDGAWDEYLRARSIEPDYASVHIELGKKYLHAGLAAQAERELTLGVSLRDDYADGHYHLGLLHRQRGDLPGAVLAFKAAVAAAPGYADALLALAQVELDRGNADGARALMGQVRLARPTAHTGKLLAQLEARLATPGDPS